MVCTVELWIEQEGILVLLAGLREEDYVEDEFEGDRWNVSSCRHWCFGSTDGERIVDGGRREEVELK